jgi:hypothetical protein
MQIKHRRGFVRDGVFQLGHRRPASQPDVNQFGAGNTQRLVVRKAMGALDNNFIPHALGVGQFGNFTRVVTGHTGRGLQYQP